MKRFTLLEGDLQRVLTERIPFFQGNLFPTRRNRTGVHVPAPHAAAGTMNEEIPAVDRCVTELAGGVQRLGHVYSLV